MSYLFMDESGCLGFDFSKQGTSRYFVITCFFVGSKRPFEKLVKQVHSGLPKKLKNGVLHCCKEKPVTRQRMLKKLAEKECSIMTIYLNKAKVYTHLQDEKHVLYNYVTNILIDRILPRRAFHITDKLILVASKRETNRFLNMNFDSYLRNKTVANHKIRLEVQIKTPAEEKVLQLADFVSWAIYRKYERRDGRYYNLIKRRIIEENALFP